MDSLRKKLRKFTHFGELKELAERLFQKDVQITSDLSDLLTKISEGKDGIGELRHFILTKVELTLSGKNHRLPDRLESYVSFFDLTYVLQHSKEKIWHTYALKDYQRDIHDADSDPFVGVKTVRKSIKKVLARNVPDMTASVQQDMRLTQEKDSESERAEMIYYRIATVTGKTAQTIEKRLCSTRATYIVYFPREPYIYTDSNKPDPNHIQALVEALHCSGTSNVSLCGRNVESLRKMRTIRDRKKSNPDGDVMVNEENVPATPPRLENFTMKYVSASGEEDISIDFRGTNVLGGLSELMKSEVFPEKTPAWAFQAVSRGRNTIKVVERRDPDENDNDDDDVINRLPTDQRPRRERDLDAMSDVTAM